MATFEATIHPVAFAHMEGGMKTVYVSPYTDDLSFISSGDRIEFDRLGSISIGTVRRYGTLSELIDAEGFANIVPEADNADHASELLRSSPEWNLQTEGDKGVMALRVRWAKRKN